jgi:cytochrome c-type biogenesis protein CcmE
MTTHPLKKDHNLKWLFATILIFILVGALSFISLNSNAVYFYTPEEAYKQAQKLQNTEIRIGGMVKTQSVRWQPQTLDLSFTITNMQGVEIFINHRGAPPDMFKENSGVVVEGFLDKQGKNFRANKLMVKHSEEYRIPSDLHTQNTKLIQKSILK